MTRRNRSVANRQQSLNPVPPERQVSLYGAQQMYTNVGGKEFHCTINAFCRTQIFEFPGIDFRPNGEEPHHNIYSSPSVQAYTISNLLDYFENSTHSIHYNIDPRLQRKVRETDEKTKSQLGERIPLFVVIEEFEQLTPTQMVKGECHIMPAVVMKDGEVIPLIIGGREGEEYILAMPTTDGEWPELPNNQQVVNLILAGVRVGQKTPEPIQRYLDMNGLVTDDRRFVTISQPTMSASIETLTQMDIKAYRTRVSEIRNAISALDQDITSPHIALLINAMYRDEHRDDAYQRLHYLQLWQSLAESGEGWLDYQGNIRNDNAVVAGNKTLLELKNYRDDIAHWWTDTINASFLADLQRTINELIRRKYF